MERREEGNGNDEVEVTPGVAQGVQPEPAPEGDADKADVHDEQDSEDAAHDDDAGSD